MVLAAPACVSVRAEAPAQEALRLVASTDPGTMEIERAGASGMSVCWRYGCNRDRWSAPAMVARRPESIAACRRGCSASSVRCKKRHWQ